MFVTAARTALALALCGVIVSPAARAQTVASTPACNTSIELSRLASPLPHVSKHLAAGDPITIVALGSSSTAGAGASSPSLSYPSRLAVELERRFPGHPFRVVNRGVNGEEARDMLARFEQVASEKPDLVIWQVGTNALLRDDPVAPALLQDGVRRMKALGADVVLLDPQFAPKVLAKADVRSVVEQIAATAKSENVEVFQRFALMKKWHNVERIPFDAFVAPDGLHMNDWSYGCLAKVMASSIAEAATRPVATVSATTGVH